MNKISKKIVSLVTMAAFALTLVPAAAFAAPNTASAQIDASVYGVISNGQIVKETAVDKDEEFTTEFVLKDENGDGTEDPIGGTNNVWIWATDASGKNTSALEVTPVGDAPTVAKTQNQTNIYKLQGPVESGDQYTVSFSREGKYTLHAGYTSSNTGSDVKDVTEFGSDVEGNNTVVTVNDNTVVDRIGLYYNGDPINFDADTHMGDLNLIGDDFLANVSDTCTVGGYAYEKDGSPAKNMEINLTSGKDSVLWFVGEAEDGVVTTDENGYFEFQFKMNDNRNVPITITANDVKYTLRIIKEETKAYDIDTVQDGGYVLAGTDTENWASVVDANGYYTLSDGLQFSVATVAGDPVTGDLATQNTDGTWSGEPAATLKMANHAQFVDVTEKPTKSTLDGWDLRLVPYGDNYTLQYVGGNETKDLLPGKYTVTVSLLSGDSAEASFNVAEFGTVEDITLDINATDVSSGRETVITDEITLGQNVEVTAQFVDENGLKIDAKDGEAVIGGYGKAAIDEKVGKTFATKPDVAANESLLGTTITVIGYSDKYGVDTSVELTVVDSYNAFTLEFDPAEGAVNKDNKVTVKVVDEDGDLAQVDGDLRVYVADQSNEDATVTAEVSKPVADGKGQIIVYASEATTVELAVAVVDDSNNGVYVGHLDYAVGADQLLAHHNVVMTIGSSEYVVDKQLFTMDAAPYVDSNWRTMVPIRALAEAFDATVTYDNDDRTVTIEYDNQTIVMTIDDATYSVNGVEAEMDTEAVINSDDNRTYVPVRFAAEAMGFTVTALYDDNSSTASVVFQS